MFGAYVADGLINQRERVALGWLASPPAATARSGSPLLAQTSRYTVRMFLTGGWRAAREKGGLRGEVERLW